MIPVSLIMGFLRWPNTLQWPKTFPFGETCCSFRNDANSKTRKQNQHAAIWKTCSIKPKQYINSKHNANIETIQNRKTLHIQFTQRKVSKACWGALSGTARVRPDETAFVCVAGQHKKVFGCRDIPILMITAIFKNEIYCRYCVNNKKNYIIVQTIQCRR